MSCYKRFSRSDYVLGLVLVFAWMMPHFVLGEATYIRIHDYLDSIVVWSKVLVDQQQLFSAQSAIVEPIMNGIPRSSLPGEFTLLSLLMLVLPAFKALIAGEIVMRVTAFFGMLLWVRSYALEEHPYKDLIATCVAAMFCTLPFWPGGGVSVAGVPLVLWAFFDSRREGVRLAHVVTMAYFAAFSGLAGVGIFLIAFLGVIWGVGWLRGERRLAPFILIVALCLFYLLFEYRLLLSVIRLEVMESHRKEMVLATVSLGAAWEAAKENLYEGQYHALALPKPYMKRAVELAILVPLIAFCFGRRIDARIYRRLLVWCGATLLTSLIYGLWQWSEIQRIWLSTGLPYINLARFHWLQPAFWLLVMALALGVLSAYLPKWRKLVHGVLIVITLLQLRVNWMASDFRMEEKSRGVSYEQFYSSPLFEDIARSIGLPKSGYRVGMLGIHPAIAHYNGFYTVDGYVANYPLEYKHRFRTVISRELDRDEALARYFDEWGSRAYLFSSELKYCDGVCVKSIAPDSVIHRLDVDAFRALGGRFIFSATAIGNARTLGLVEFGVFERSDSPWRIHVYGLKSVN